MSLSGALRRLAVASGVALVLACGGSGRCGRDGAPPASPGDASTAASSASPADLPSADVGSRPTIADPRNITAEEVDALTRWLVPYVEQAGGARFTTIPKGELGTPDNLADVLEKETKEIVGRIYDLPPEVIDRMARESRAGIPGLLGKYAPSTGAVYLVPAGVARMADGLGSEVDPLDVATLIMAHELGHALQDQVGDLDAVFGGLEDLDHFDGARGITEGHANWITLRVARALDLEDAFWVLSRGQGWGQDGLENPGAFSVWMLYGQGMAFCEHHAAQGGTDALWAMVKAPPRSTTMLFRPERYATTVSDRPEGVSQALVGVEQALTRTPDWVVADTHLGEAPLRKETLGLEAERVETVLDGIVWGHERRMYVPGGSSVAPRSAALMLIRFQDGTQARALVDLLSDGLQAQADARTQAEKELASKLRGVEARTWEVEARPYDRVEGDAVIRRVVGPTSPSGARLAKEEEQSLWVVRGDLLVVVTVSGFRPGNRLDKAVKQLFEQVEGAGLLGAGAAAE